MLRTVFFTLSVLCFAGDSPAEIVSHTDLVFAKVDGQELKLDLLVPKTESPPPLVVWIHGGGWRSGSKKNPRIGELKDHGFAVASISYRFSKTAIFPAQIHDCKAAIRWLRAHAADYGYNADWIGVAGGSAGGHLALMMGVSAGVVELEGKVGTHPDQSSRVQAVIDYYGPSDFVLRGKTQPERAYTNQSGSLALMGGKDGKIDPKMERFASPITYVSKDDAPLLIFHGDADKVVLPDQSKAIHSRYRKVGLNSTLVIQKGVGHGASELFTGKHFETALSFFQKQHQLYLKLRKHGAAEI